MYNKLYLQDPPEKHFGDVSNLDKYDNDNNELRLPYFD